MINADKYRPWDGNKEIRTIPADPEVDTLHGHGLPNQDRLDVVDIMNETGLRGMALDQYLRQEFQRLTNMEVEGRNLREALEVRFGGPEGAFRMFYRVLRPLHNERMYDLCKRNDQKGLADKYIPALH